MLLLWIVGLLRGLREGVGRLLGSWVWSLSGALVIHRWVRHIVLAICVRVVAHGHGHLAIPDGEKKTKHWVGKADPQSTSVTAVTSVSTRAFPSILLLLGKGEGGKGLVSRYTEKKHSYHELKRISHF